jgi:hypothetical protein
MEDTESKQEENICGSASPKKKRMLISETQEMLRKESL